MKNKKLLSVLVSAVLLCACIAGVFMMGANAEVVTTTYTVGEGQEYATIKEALHAAAGETWAANSALVIEFTGEDTSAIVKAAEEGESTHLFFGQTTIFNAEGEKLPITIRGVDSDPYANAIAFAPGSWSQNVTYWAFANDYTFENLFIPFGEIGGTGGQFTHVFAGSGEVVFNNVEFLPDGQAWADTVASHTVRLYGDNFTMDAFYGWELAEGETVKTSITIGENCRYLPGNVTNNNLNAVGYDPAYTIEATGSTAAEMIASAKLQAAEVEFEAGDLATECNVRPINTETAIIIDTGDAAYVSGTRNPNYSVGWVAARLKSSPVASATAEIRSGVAPRIHGDDFDAATETLVGDTIINVKGGAVYQEANGYGVVGLRAATLYGDLSINLSENEAGTYVRFLQGAGGSSANLTDLYGTYRFNMSGGEILNLSYGVSGRQGVITKISGGKVGTAEGSNRFFSTYFGTLGNLPADVIAAEIPAEYSQHIDGSVAIYNELSGNADIWRFICGSGDSTNQPEIGNIVNVFDGGIVRDEFRQGAYNYNKFGNVTNIVTGGTFTNPYYGLWNAQAGDENDTITNVVLDGTFYGFIGGAKSHTYRSVVNKIYGGTFYQSTVNLNDSATDEAKKKYAFIGGGLAGRTGNVTNTIEGGDFVSISLDQNYFGGNVVGSVGTVTNTITDADFAGGVYFGSKAATTASVTNTVSGGNFGNHIYGGSDGGTVTGDISTTFSGTPTGLPSKTFYGAGGSSAVATTVKGNVTNRFEFTAPASGNNINTVIGGTRNGNIEGNIFNYFVSGKFGTLRTASNNATDTVGDIYNEIGAIEMSDTLYVAQCGEVGNITNKINGLKMTGTSKDLYLGAIVSNSVVTGNITNEFKGEVIVSRHVYCAGGMSGANNYVVKGDVTTTVDMTAPATGKNVASQFYTGGRTGSVEGTITTNFNSGSLATVICGAYGDTIGSVGAIENHFNGATMTYLETARGIEIGSLTNYFTAGTFPNISNMFHAGPIGAAKVGSITNNISGTATFTGVFYAGGEGTATITGTITNNISGGNFGGLTFLGSSGGTTGNIVNTISGGTFNGHVYGASQKGTVNGDVSNSLSGAPDFTTKIFYGGGGDSTNAITVTGSITNEVSLAEGVSLSGGFRGGNRNGSSGDITNKLISGNFGGINGTNQAGNAGAITNEFGAITATTFNAANGTVASITNTFNGAVFSDHVYAGVVNGTVTGNITNTIIGETVFAKNFFAAGGASGAAATIKGNVTTTFSATPVEGTNNSGSAYYGGVRMGSVEGKITNIITSGVFNNLFGGSYAGIDGTVADVETIVKGGTIKNYLRPDRNDASNATGSITLVIDLSEADVALLSVAKAYDENEASTVTIKGGEYKLLLGAGSNVVADELVGNLNVEMTEEPEAKEVYLTISGDVKDSISVTSAIGVTSPVVKVDGAVTKVMGLSGNTLNVQLLLGDKIYIRALFNKAAVQAIDGFTYSFVIDGKTVTGTVADMEEINVDGTDYYAVTLDGMGVSSFEKEIGFTATDYIPVDFSIASLAVSAEAAWTKEGKTEWVEVAKAIQNLNAVYNSGEENAYTPEAVEGAPTVTKYPLANKVQAGSLSVAPIMNGAVGLRFTFTLTEAPSNFNVEVGGVNVNEWSNITVENNVVTAEIYFNAEYGTENANFLFLDGQTAYFCVNTSVAQIAAQCAANEANTQAERANANALVYFLQTIKAANN